MFQQPGSAPASMATNTPFPEFKTTGDDKHDIEVFIEDLTDYCVMQNWFDPLKDTEAAKWTKPDKAMALISGQHYPVRLEQCTNTAWDLPTMIRRSLTWFSML